MIVPRAYMDKQKRAGHYDIQNEKATPVVESRRSQRPRPLKADALRLPTSPLAETYSPATKMSAPVQIPRRSRKPRSPAAVLNDSGSLQELQVQEPGTSGTMTPASATPVKSLLSSTAIPLRRKQGARKSQKLPKGDHVADFSKLILEDISANEARSSAGSFGNPHLEELFGHSVDTSEPWKPGDHSGAAASPFSARSMSIESMPSLLIDDELTDPSLSDLPSPVPLQSRNSSDRRIRTLSTSEDCADDHPLQALDPLEPLTPLQEDKRLLAPSLSPPPEKSRNFSLRSNLTASLRALKSAAQSVSNLGMSPPLTRPDDFLTRSIFSFAPELTDDKRPPPSSDPPSPALRRYLNPQPTTIETITYSPAELHSYHEYPSRNPPSSRKKKPTLPSLNPLNPRSQPPQPQPRTIQIPLRTCLPPAHRTLNASSPPIWLSPDGTPLAQAPSFNCTTLNPSLARQREPRENPAFLRVLVGEMNMRRAGKFDEAAPGRARIWLPARKGGDNAKVDGVGNGNGDKKMITGRERWVVMNAADREKN